MEQKKNLESGMELLENPEALQETLSKTEEFAKKNQNLILGVIGGLLLVVGIGFWYDWYLQENNTEAQQELFPAVFFLEKDSVAKALAGDGGNTTIGLNGIADEYASSKAGKLANLYIGIAKMQEASRAADAAAKNKKFDEAIAALENFNPDDYLVQARVYCLIGDAYSEKNEVAKAIDFYKKASEHYPNEFFTPTYLIKLGLAYETQKNWKDAAQAYQKIVKEYKASEDFAKAEKLLAKAQKLGGK